MRFSVYGKKDGLPVMLIHGMAETAHSCFDSIIPKLSEYCIILAEVDGHYPQSVYASADKCCEEIEKYVCESFGGRMHGLVGFSMGGSISVKLMGRGNIAIENVILDAAFCVKRDSSRARTSALTAE